MDDIQFLRVEPIGFVKCTRLFELVFNRLLGEFGFSTFFKPVIDILGDVLVGIAFIFQLERTLVVFGYVFQLGHKKLC